MVENLPAMQETRVQSLGWEDLLEKDNSSPLQHSHLQNSTHREAWQATVHGVPESDMTKWEGGHGLVGPRGSRWSAGEYPPGLRARLCTVNLSWHCPGSEMEALRLLDPLGKMLEYRAWVGLAARVPWKKVPSSGAHSWTLSSSQALRTHLVYDRLNSLK